MHYLHPRSRTTGTLFTTTLAISFLVVGLPHLLPCPVDRTQFADSYETHDGRIMRRKRRATAEGAEDAHLVATDGSDEGRPKRECPIPKPTGLVGQIMGFKNEERPKPAEIIVQTLEAKRTKRIAKESEDTP